MTTDRIKVGQLDELPPGKGKIISVHGREVTVYNREGRYVATASGSRTPFAGTVESTCDMPGHRFDTGSADSPDRLQIDEVHYRVVVDDGSVFVVVVASSAR